MRVGGGMVKSPGFAALFYLYPFGVFFRAFEPTRLFGGTLIGLSLSFFLFYPVILVFNDYIVRGPTGTEGFLAPVQQELEQAIDEAELKSNPASGQLPVTDKDSVETGGPALSDPATRDTLVENVSYGLLFLLRPLLLYFIAAVVLPIINFIVLVEITRGITRLFGEEVDVTNITRMI